MLPLILADKAKHIIPYFFATPGWAGFSAQLGKARSPLKELRVKMGPRDTLYLSHD